MYDRRLHAYTAIIIIASILVTPFLSMATAQPNARFSLAEWESSDVESCKLYNHSDTSYVDETTDANDADPSDVPLLQPPAAPPQVNDAIYIGSSAPIPALAFDISTQGVGSWVITWEYYNGSSWNSLEDVEDDTNGFLTEYGDGLCVTWTMPSDWAETTVDGNTYYWVRARVSTFAAMGFQPKGDQIYRLSSAPLSEGEQWAFDSAFIFLGLIMIPASALYLVRGGKDGLSSDKLFYALIVFFMGCGFFIGGIMP